MKQPGHELELLRDVGTCQAEDEPVEPSSQAQEFVSFVLNLHLEGKSDREEETEGSRIYFLNAHKDPGSARP